MKQGDILTHPDGHTRIQRLAKKLQKQWMDELRQRTHIESDKKWGATAYSCDICNTGFVDAYGSTAEEAVANLWLALNKE